MAKKSKSREWQTEFDLASKIIGAPVTWSAHAYEAFRYDGGDVKLIFYPHKTSAGHYHIRVRDGGSKDVPAADRLMRKLDDESGYNCTFTRKMRG